MAARSKTSSCTELSGGVLGKGHGGEEDPEETLELARWRSTSFGAVSGSGAPGMTVIKARFEDNNDGIENEQALLPRDVKPSGLASWCCCCGQAISARRWTRKRRPGAVITALRYRVGDGFRGNWLAVNVSMLGGERRRNGRRWWRGIGRDTGWAGIYVAKFLDDESLTP